MRRIKLVLAVVAAMAALIAVTATPAFAASNDGRFFFNNNHNNNDGRFFFNNNDGRFFNDGFFNNNGVTQAIGQESETGNVNVGFNATQTGNNSNQCVTPLQFGNTGSLQNGQGVLTVGTPFFDNNNDGRFFDNNHNNDGRFFNNGGFFSPFNQTELEGSTFTFTPTLNATCNQQVQQSAAAG